MIAITSIKAEKHRNNESENTGLPDLSYEFSSLLWHMLLKKRCSGWAEFPATIKSRNISAYNSSIKELRPSFFQITLIGQMHGRACLIPDFILIKPKFKEIIRIACYRKICELFHPIFRGIDI